MTKQEEFLLREYDSAVKLTYHVDEMRSRLVSYFLTIGGIISAGLALVLKGDIAQEREHMAMGVVSFLLISYAVIGAIFVAIIGRLRRAQFEHFRIINNIREYFIKDSLELWNTVQLSSATLPGPKRTTGSYLWSLPVSLVSASSCGFGAFILLEHVALSSKTSWSLILSFSLGITLFVALDKLYINRCRLGPPTDYTGKSLPPRNVRG